MNRASDSNYWRSVEQKPTVWCWMRIDAVQRVRTEETTTGHCAALVLLAADPDGRSAWGTHSLAEFVVRLPARQSLQELNGHSPRRSNLCTSTSAITRWKKLGRLRRRGRGLVGVGRWAASGGGHGRTPQVGNLNDSPLVSTAQAMRAFLAAMATTAFQ